MKETDKLISDLSRDLKPQTSFSASPILWLTGLLSFLSLISVIGIFLYFRPSWGLSAALKTGVFIFLSLGLGLLVHRKSVLLKLGFAKVMVFFFSLAATFYVFLYFSVMNLSLTEVIAKPTFLGCISFIAGFGSLIFLFLRFILVRARPQKARLFSASLGALSASLAATAYSLSCSIDSASYVFVAYGAGLFLVIILGYLFPRKTWTW